VFIYRLKMSSLTDSKVSKFLLSVAYGWQTQQMGPVSRHPLQPGGLSARSSCTGSTSKHRLTRSRTKANIKQTNQVLIWARSIRECERMTPFRVKQNHELNR